MKNVAIKTIMVPTIVFNVQFLTENKSVILLDNNYVQYRDEQGNWKTDTEEPTRRLVRVIYVSETKLEVQDAVTNSIYYFDIEEFNGDRPIFSLEIAHERDVS